MASPEISFGSRGRMSRTMDRNPPGISPQWTKDCYRQPINARSETLLDEPTFRRLLNQEISIWRSDSTNGSHTVVENRSQKVTIIFSSDWHGILPVAGLYEKSVGVSTCLITWNLAILTAGANEMMAQYHDRMPVILDHIQVPGWIFGEAGNDHLDLIIQYQCPNCLTRVS